jgi:hypothetical protein
VGQGFLSRVRNTSIVTGLLIAWIIAAKWEVAAGAGWLIGCAWTITNLYFIGVIVRIALSRKPNSRLHAILATIVKVPVLYGIGFLLLSREWLLSGFMWPLIVSTLKILARTIMRMDENVKEPRGNV